MPKIEAIAREDEKQDAYCGRIFERWVVVEFAGWTKNHLRLYKVKCDCGKEKVVYKCALDRGQSKSCGCLAKEQTSARSSIDAVGHRFGRLVAVEIIGKNRYGNIWRCQCDCGEETAVVLARLGKSTNSCGCLAADNTRNRSRTHGATMTKEYRSWQQMRSRSKPQHEASERYAEKGIRVCDRWDSSFTDFLKDVGYAPSPEHTIDRLDNTKGYEPGNVRWATDAEQNQNKGDNLVFVSGGRAMSKSEWGREFGLVENTSGNVYWPKPPEVMFSDRGLKIDWSGRRRDMPFKVDPETKMVIVDVSDSANELAPQMSDWV